MLSSHSRSDVLSRQVLYAPNSQPILIAGSGTLGWDQASNILHSYKLDILTLLRSQPILSNRGRAHWCLPLATSETVSLIGASIFPWLTDHN